MTSQKGSKTKYKAEDLEIIYSLDKKLIEGIELHRFIRLFSNAVKKNFNCFGASVLLLDDKNKHLILQNQTIESRVVKKFEDLLKIKISQIKINYSKEDHHFMALEKNRPILLNSYEDIYKLLLEYATSNHKTTGIMFKSIKRLIPTIYKMLGIKSVLLVPLTANSVPIGVMDVSSKRQFSKEEIDRIHNLSRQVSIAINKQNLEQELKTSYLELDNIFNTTSNAMRVLDRNGFHIKANKAFCKISGYEMDDIIRKKCSEIFYGPDCDTPDCLLKNVLEKKKTIRKIVVKYTKKKGKRTFIVVANPLRGPDGKIVGIVEDFTDITDRLKSEKKLKIRSEKINQLQVLLDFAPDAIFIKNKKSQFILNNKAHLEYLGVSDQKDALGKTDFDFFPKELVEKEGLFSQEQKIIKTGEPIINDEKEIYLKPGGKKIWVSDSKAPFKDSRGKIVGIVGVVKDIKKQKKAETNLKKERDRVKKLFDTAGTVLLTLDSKGRVSSINKKGIELLGYKKQEILGKDWFDNFLPKKIRTQVKLVFKKLMAGEIKPVEYYENEISNKKGKKRIIVWHNTILKNEKGDITGVLSSGEDITAIKKANKKLEKFSQNIIRALAVLVETNDPYTAGHQERVQKVCAIIAKEMALNKKKIDALNRAALLHDIGKVTIPQSILSKPGKITDIEFAMIKNHPQVGFDVIKDVDFGYPVRNIILQHHERENGSGYPKGIKGSNIMIEAKILAVVDVVEAMTSHRPYRPALGIDEAIKEIMDKKGELYDSRIVNICVELIKKGKISLKTIEEEFQAEGALRE